jgi:glycosyltransferase involved in cell wall biosynthesis
MTEKNNETTKRKIKVLFPYVGGDDFGGSHISSLKLIDLLNQTGQFNAVAGLHRPTGLFPDFLAKNGYEFEHLPFPNLIEPKDKRDKSALKGVLDYVTKTAPKIVSYINKNEIDIVHTNDGRMHLNWVVPTKFSKAESVWHHRGNPSAKATNLFAPLFADQIITVSKFSKPSKPVKKIDHKWNVVHSPFDIFERVDRKSAKEGLLAELKLPKDTFVLGYFGELIERKRPVVFAEIIAEYAKAHPETKVVGIVAGAVPTGARRLDQEMMSRARELGIEDLIKPLGFRSPIEPIMAATDILLVPAFNEPFGRTLIEAMHLGTAVVATHHGGNPEAIQESETGFLVSVESPAKFVEPIHKLLTNKTLFDKITRNAQAYVRKNLTLETHLSGVMTSYKRLDKAGKNL